MGSRTAALGPRATPVRVRRWRRGQRTPAEETSEQIVSTVQVADTRGMNALVVQDDSEQRVVDLQAVPVVDESQAHEFLHEEVHARTRRPDNLRQCLL